MTWILVFFLHGKINALYSDFESKASCEEAGQDFVKLKIPYKCIRSRNP